MLRKVFLLTDREMRPQGLIDHTLVSAAEDIASNTHISCLRKLDDANGGIRSSTKNIYELVFHTESDKETVLTTFKDALPFCSFMPLPS